MLGATLGWFSLVSELPTILRVGGWLVIALLVVWIFRLVFPGKRS